MRRHCPIDAWQNRRSGLGDLCRLCNRDCKEGAVVVIVGNLCPALGQRTIGGAHVPAQPGPGEEHLIQKIRIKHLLYTLNFCEACGSAYLMRTVVKEKSDDDRQSKVD